MRLLNTILLSTAFAVSAVSAAGQVPFSDPQAPVLSERVTVRKAVERMREAIRQGIVEFPDSGAFIARAFDQQIGGLMEGDPNKYLLGAAAAVRDAMVEFLNERELKHFMELSKAETERDAAKVELARLQSTVHGSESAAALAAITSYEQTGDDDFVAVDEGHVDIEGFAPAPPRPSAAAPVTPSKPTGKKKKK
jgi:hypothetical protein